MFCLFVVSKNNQLIAATIASVLCFFFLSFTSRNSFICIFNKSSPPLTSLVTVTFSGAAPVMPEAQRPWQRCHANSNHVLCLATKQLSAPGGLSQQLTRNKHLLCCSCYVRGRGGGGVGEWGVRGSRKEASEIKTGRIKRARGEKASFADGCLWVSDKAATESPCSCAC